VSYDGRTVPFDLLVTVPLNMGADFVARSGLGDELNYVPVDPKTFLARGHDDVFAIGDACDIPTSKAGSVAHFAVDVFIDNLLDYVAGRLMTHEFDGHATASSGAATARPCSSTSTSTTTSSRCTDGSPSRSSAR
jgi:sulfide:quinone oxidoreductase